MYQAIIVEDERNIRVRLKQHFDWKAYDINIVADFDNGQSALDYIRCHPVSIVMTDIRMPRMTGIELAKQLSITFPKIIIVFITAYSEFEYAQQAIEYNVRGYLLKPIMKEHFQQTMSKISILLKEESEDKRDSLLHVDKNYPPYVQFSIEYAYENYHETISLKDIADKLFINEAYFSNLFSQVTGMRYMHFVNHIRINKAAQLLEETSLSSKEISDKVGFMSHSYFNRVFKQQKGISPLMYRKINQLR